MMHENIKIGINMITTLGLDWLCGPQEGGSTVMYIKTMSYFRAKRVKFAPFNRIKHNSV